MTRQTWLDSDGQGMSAYTRPTPAQRRMKPWHWVLLGVLGLMTVCFVGVAVAGRPLPKDPVIPGYDNAPATGTARTGSQPPPTVAAPAPVTVTGKNNAAKPIGATLNGAYNVEYAFGSWCGIASFLKADGTDGARFMESINDCAGDTNAKASGSTVVHLANVTMVKVENTRGDWSLKFTKLA